MGDCIHRGISAGATLVCWVMPSMNGDLMRSQWPREGSGPEIGHAHTTHTAPSTRSLCPFRVSDIHRGGSGLIKGDVASKTRLSVDMLLSRHCWHPRESRSGILAGVCVARAQSRYIAHTSNVLDGGLLALLIRPESVGRPAVPKAPMHRCPGAQGEKAFGLKEIPLSPASQLVHRKMVLWDHGPWVTVIDGDNRYTLHITEVQST